MSEGVWVPACRRPEGLVPARRIDESGVAGPTTGQARGPSWHRCAPGYYVPVDRPRHVEQRILEQAARLNPSGAVTAWAALRWQGAAYFDGLSDGGVDPLPVVLLLGSGGGRPHPGSAISKAQLAAADRRQVGGLWVTTPHRALFDEVVRRRPDLWSSVAAIDMTCAAGLTTPAQFAAYVTHRCAWEGVPHVREAVRLSRGGLRSPREVWLDLVWRLVARLPMALANVPVFGLDGSFLGIPDLLDPEAGLVAEYDGAHHLRATQRRRDVERESLLRAHGLEYVTVLRGDTRRGAAERILQARSRAHFTLPAHRAWTLEPPAWWLARRPAG